jgi:16S rRNA (guanine1207-N2)-methyltransferase
MAPGQYFDRAPDAPSRPRTITLSLPDLDVELVTDRAVFAGARIDPGTKYLLLEAPPPPADATALLDLGCGYGPIAVALARRAPDATVWAVDVNERALDLCRANAERAGVSNVRVCDPDEVPADVRFDGIWSNPPIRIGKAALHELLVRWLDLLTDEGRAHLVVQKHLGADSLASWLADEGWTVTRLGSRQGYRLLDVERTPTA